ncbi:MAG: hypothetical protein GF421_08100 [Candidatus Aminicenantes bacterium]|nr:hypothetical protein [Candidatus Aminicenantes bacterium]
MNITADKIKRKSIAFIKSFKLSPHPDTKLLFVMGYGRSGTTILMKLFQYSWNTEVHGETSKKLMDHFMLKKHRVLSLVEKSKAEVLIGKPILNSLEIPKILNEYEHLKVIWMIRNHKDVVHSALEAFGNKVWIYLKDLVTQKNPSDENWISRTASSEIISTIQKMNHTRFSKQDWMALVWWAVNSTLLSENLHTSPRIKVIRYEDFVQNPMRTMRQIETFVGVNFNKKATRFVFSQSVGKGKHIRLNPVVDQMCSEIQNFEF